MARVFKPTKKQLPSPAKVAIHSLSSECEGIGHFNGKTVFVPQCYPGDTVRVKFTGTVKGSYRGQLINVETPSRHRRTAQCRHFDQCGGCSIMSLNQQQQTALKQQNVLSALHKQAGLTPDTIEPALESQPFAYRSTARLSLRHQSGGWRLGYRAKSSHQLVAIDGCPVLAEGLQALIPELQAWLVQVPRSRRLGHIELLQDERRVAVLLRTAEPLEAAELCGLESLCQRNGADLWLKVDQQPAKLQHGDSSTYHYSLPDLGLTLEFGPEAFTQVNRTVNQQMVTRAMAWLAAAGKQSGKLQHVVDLYCGVGNFSLPLAQIAQSVVGVELYESMVHTARRNAQHNGIENALFVGADLSRGADSLAAAVSGQIDAVLLDPPRAGAAEVLPALISARVPLLLYVSCNPATLVRDAQTLAASGYRLSKLCVMDMFPQTKHVETMALFCL